VRAWLPQLAAALLQVALLQVALLQVVALPLVVERLLLVAGLLHLVDLLQIPDRPPLLVQHLRILERQLGHRPPVLLQRIQERLQPLVDHLQRREIHHPQETHRRLIPVTNGRYIM
jgi:hypothetical protein